mmetsp:Transcript_45734/g.62305  ORF Transcript_45734/g.62305 Transcript_45734/m.62305 type:complete len:163 (-) Transcript_45734:50-538(-)
MTKDSLSCRVARSQMNNIIRKGPKKGSKNKKWNPEQGGPSPIRCRMCSVDYDQMAGTKDKRPVCPGVSKSRNCCCTMSTSLQLAVFPLLALISKKANEIGCESGKNYPFKRLRNSIAQIKNVVLKDKILQHIQEAEEVSGFIGANSIRVLPTEVVPGSASYQ